MGAAVMKIEPFALAAILLVGAVAQSAAFPLDGRDQQRKQYPANWNDTKNEKPLFDCYAPQAGAFRIKIGASDSQGRTMMSLVPIARPAHVEETTGILRIWSDAEQTKRLRAGKYLATVVRKENSCWTRGDLGGDTVFLLDNTKPPADEPDKAGSFYNKAPRFSVYESDYYSCEPVK